MRAAPEHLAPIAERVDGRLNDLLAAERGLWANVDPRITEAFDELIRMSGGGKRLRAAFCFWGWAGATGVGLDAIDTPAAETSLRTATAFELLQAFALIHDDIMDDAATRRGERTIHAAQEARMTAEGWRGEPRRYGEGVAILIGDLSHVYADQLVGEIAGETRRLWDQLRIELNLGQYLDMRSAAAAEIDQATARRVATFKSALYTIVRPLQVGASLAGPVDAEFLEQLEAYGVPAGQAFQLRDDLLGILGDPSTVGKPVGHDLREGKPTELLAVALEAADATQAAVLARVGEPDLAQHEVEAIVGVLHDVGAISEINRRIDDLTTTAVEAAQGLPWTDAAVSALVDLARYVAARQH